MVVLNVMQLTVFTVSAGHAGGTGTLVVCGTPCLTAAGPVMLAGAARTRHVWNGEWRMSTSVSCIAAVFRHSHTAATAAVGEVRWQHWSENWLFLTLLLEASLVCGAAALPFHQSQG